MEGDVLVASATSHVAMRYVIALSIALAMAILGGALAAFRWLVKRLIDGMDERLTKIEESHVERDRQQAHELERLERERAMELRRLELDIQTLRAELPLHYLRREDHVRDMTQISAKLDRIYELMLMPRGGM